MNYDKDVLSMYISLKLHSSEWENRKPHAYIDKAEIEQFFSGEKIVISLLKKIDICDNRYYILTLEEDYWTDKEIEEIEYLYLEKFVKSYQEADTSVLPENKRKQLDEYFKVAKDKIKKKLEPEKIEPVKIEETPVSLKNKLMKELLESLSVKKVHENKDKLTMHEIKYLKNEITKKLKQKV